MNIKSWVVAAVLMAGVVSPSFAGDRTAGGLIGAAAGAVIGNGLGGNDGAVFGAIAGAAVGVAVADNGHHRDDRRYYSNARYDNGYDRRYAPVYYNDNHSRDRVYRERVVYRSVPYGYRPDRGHSRGYYDRRDYYDRDRHDHRHDHDRRDDHGRHDRDRWDDRHHGH